MMALFAQYLVSGLALGCVFALIASGIVVIARVTGVVNFSQGVFAVLGGFVASGALAANLGHGFSEVLALIVCAATGVLAGIIVLGTKRTTPDGSMILSLGFGILLYAPLALIWGDQPRSLEGLTGTLTLGTVTVSNQYLLAMVVTAITFAALSLFFARSYIGKAFTACASNADAARTLGINVRLMGIASFAIAAVLGGIAGILLMPIQPMSFNSDVSLVLNGFAAAVFGMLTRPLRALIGALLLGVIQSLAAGYLSAAYQLPIALILLIAILIVRSGKKELHA